MYAIRSYYAGDLTVNGYITNNGVLKTDDATASLKINGTLYSTSTASINMVGGGTLYFSDGSIFESEGSFTAGTGTVDFTGDGTVIGTLAFNNLIIEGNVDPGTNRNNFV